jgi:thiol:disulfide interchange protein DsbD
MEFKSCCKLSAVLLFLPCLFAQSNAILTVAPPQKVAAKRNTDVTAKIEVSIAAGYHVNSNAPHEAYLIPLRLTWTPAPLEVGAVTFPKARDEKYRFSDQPLSVFTGNFEIATKFKVPADAVGGQAILVGKLRYQACNDTMCFPPKTVEVKLPVEVQ